MSALSFRRIHALHATATPTAALGSMVIFMRSHTRRMCAAMSASLTSTISSTRSRTTGKVIGPSEVRSPSAIVTGFIAGWIDPSRFDAAASPASSGSAPMMRIDGLSALAAIAMPEMRPPPPSGTTIASSCGHSSSSSSAIVPWPAITSGWLNGGTIEPPVSAITRDAVHSRASSVGSHSTMVAP